MRRLLKIWLMLVISLAMPLQGVAAATMFHCDLAPAGAAALDQAQLRQAVHQHLHGVDDDAAGDHHHAAGPLADDDAADPQQPSSKCSACASCCTATALPSTPILLSAAELALSFDAPVASRVAPFLTHGPERPPRRFLA